ncbi:MAG: chromosomal replication initiator protein DnaA [Propionibacteriaceae bacterium]|nr:chromosomal replication initiator protein DnaA [Propionibacteriaceae bacterium]
MTTPPDLGDSPLPLFWDSLLARLGPPTRSLLATCQPRSLSWDTLDVAAPNDFTRERIAQRLRGEIEAVLLDQAGHTVHLAVTTDPSLFDENLLSTVADAAADPLPLAVPQLPLAPRPVERLNAKYTFDSFVTGFSNRFAHAAAVAVAEGAVESGPGQAYNPLLIYGDSGLGKTHLLHAIGHYIGVHTQHLSIRYVPTEELTNDFINAISQNRMAAFRRTYREVDVLLIDDIQFLESKNATQEEFFHTFNALQNAQKQIVMTSDRPPKLLGEVEPRLRSRFQSGLLVNVQPAELETRIAILQRKAASESVDIDTEIIHFIASRIHSNIRELEGALIRLTAFASLNKQPITIDMAEVVIKDLVSDDAERPITIAMVAIETANHFDMPLDELKGPGRSANVALARQIAMYLSRELTELSLPKIGTEFGRDHTTVIHAYRKISGLIAQDRSVFSTVTEITNRVRQRAQRI